MPTSTDHYSCDTAQEMLEAWWDTCASSRREDADRFLFHELTATWVPEDEQDPGRRVLRLMVNDAVFYDEPVTDLVDGRVVTVRSQRRYDCNPRELHRESLDTLIPGGIDFATGQPKPPIWDAGPQILVVSGTKGRCWVVKCWKRKVSNIRTRGQDRSDAQRWTGRPWGRRWVEVTLLDPESVIGPLPDDYEGWDEATEICRRWAAELRQDWRCEGHTTLGSDGYGELLLGDPTLEWVNEVIATGGGRHVPVAPSGEDVHGDE